MTGKARLSLALALAAVLCFVLALGMQAGWWDGTTSMLWALGGFVSLSVMCVVDRVP
jgi:hypothetical protein